MAVAAHPAAPHHLPVFLPGPDGSDWLMAVTGAMLVAMVVAFGLIFLRIHTLPERLAHRGHKLQFEIVAVLGLLALFTHIHAFWVAGLLLALIDLPDFTGPLRRIATPPAPPARRSNGHRPRPRRARRAEPCWNC
jgi:hypothetical protein